MSELLRTPLYDLHTSLGAKMVPFAGYEMPVQYPLGVMKEHLACREGAGLFDVSHMTQIVVESDSVDPAKALERLVPQSVLGLKFGRQRYGFLTNDAGGIIDDLMIARISETRVHVVANAAGRETVMAHLRRGLPDCSVEEFPNAALLAVQGPTAEAVVSAMIPGAAAMNFMDYQHHDGPFGPLDVARSGYTGEDGFEISVGAAQAGALARAFLDEGATPIGLGARDSLRLEAGLCLHGSDIDATTTPVDAALNWAIQKVRRKGGEREGGFPGANIVLDQLENGATRKRVGLLPQGRAPMRGGTSIFAGDVQVGEVTSGGFGPSLESPVSMGYVASDHSATGTELEAEVRGKRMSLSVADMPFRPANYKR